MHTTSPLASETSLILERLKEIATKAGRIALKPALSLYFIMISDTTPLADKWVIIGTLCYVIFPVDILRNKHLPLLGWLDELAALGIIYDEMKQHLTPDMEVAIEKLLDEWLPNPIENERNITN